MSRDVLDVTFTFWCKQKHLNV